jgi:hypothetical protein
MKCHNKNVFCVVQLFRRNTALEGIWVRSQDKLLIVFSKRVSVIGNTNTDRPWRIISINDAGHDILGEYAGKEQVIEVLNEMQMLIDYSNDGDVNPSQRTMTYKMPKDRSGNDFCDECEHLCISEESQGMLKKFGYTPIPDHMCALLDGRKLSHDGQQPKIPAEHYSQNSSSCIATSSILIAKKASTPSRSVRI